MANNHLGIRLNQAFDQLTKHHHDTSPGLRLVLSIPSVGWLRREDPYFSRIGELPIDLLPLYVDVAQDRSDVSAWELTPSILQHIATEMESITARKE